MNRLLILLLSSAFLTINSCSSESQDQVMNIPTEIKNNYAYSTDELETIKLINDYRISVGLNVLTVSDYISNKCEEHDIYMIAKNAPSHDGFTGRFENIVKVLGAIKVEENIAYNYKTPQAAVDAWLKSAEHKKAIEGDFNYMGLSIKKSELNGRNYYTNIFAKI
ncbi:CAP domain-containing protein [Flavobacterium lipolyticum]|uniref:CAP domain-containing protein n=1 Tax=Flavobacterium lipolyticum TaxID=2893754 RepID=A0ABS8M414_9FLAO|nr:CAP domain-containing protein [Flavobacterium sp. F-126]MCC9019563.1 CAP domain-containing protein [Flavobacterium sp. F-126]